jgi:hypothetical protein
MRAQGNGFGVTGWAIGVGWTTLVNPIMFGHLQSRTYFLFAGFNLLWMPIVFFFYPETKNRSLESIDAMFSTPSPLYAKMEAAYKAANADLPAAYHFPITHSKVNPKGSPVVGKSGDDNTSLTHSENILDG